MSQGEKSVCLYDAASKQWLSFTRPRRVIEARLGAEVMPALREAEGEVKAGRWVAGFVAYEAAPGFDSALKTYSAGMFPLVWFGVFDQPHPIAAPVPVQGTEEVCWNASVSEAEYRSGFEEIKRLIEAGDTYQVNFSFRLKGLIRDRLWEYFAGMVQAQGEDCYPVFVDTGKHVVCSASPELFFSLQGEQLVSKPMKGTVERGLCSAEDRERARWLAESEKNRAENIMIVDMVRNDLGRIARAGSVEVTQLFEIEKYRTVWQMTSTVQARTSAGMAEIFQALFPAASITGAPKARTMEIIRALEKSPRGIYTGSVGFFAPGRRAQFNVAIRTVVVEKETGQAEYGVGGGIVWDSEGAGEWQECRVKARVLTRSFPDFGLLETLRWTPEEGFYLLEEHLRRMAESAEYFSRATDMASIRRELEKAAAGWASPQRVRLVVASNGQPVIECRSLAPLAEPYRLGLAKEPVRSREVFLYHKTTQRGAYEQARHGVEDCEDVLLWNERGELTESCIANVAVQWGGKLITPPVSCGLLPGLERARLLARGTVEEGIIRVEDLAKAEGVYLMNSVRGMWRARLDRL